MARRITVVALNPAIDMTIRVPGFAAGTTNRSDGSRLDPGGKGANVARVLAALGAAPQVLGFLGTENGDVLRRPLEDRSIPYRFVEVPGANRVNVKIVDNGRLTEINETGFTVDSKHLERLTGLVQAALADASVLVLTGSLPAGVPAACYRDLAEMARAAGVPAVLDADGEPMRLALAARPALIKPNREEAERLVGRRLASPRDLMEAAAELVARGPDTVVISGGAAGAALVNRRKERLWATPPAIRPGSPVGAGDAMVAGFALGIARGLPTGEQLRIATAAGAGTARLEGTQVCTSADVAELVPGVTVTPWTAA